jgi:hypothetical protein
MLHSPILTNAERSVEHKDVPRPPAVVENVLESPPLKMTCTACGKHHGAVQAELQCLRAHLLHFRTISRLYGTYATAVRKRNLVLAAAKKSRGKEVGIPADPTEGLDEELAALKALRASVK